MSGGLLTNARAIHAFMRAHKGVVPIYGIQRQSELLTTILMHIGVNPQTAREDACKIEHDLSEETFDAIRAFVRKAQTQGM